MNGIAAHKSEKKKLKLEKSDKQANEVKKKIK